MTRICTDKNSIFYGVDFDKVKVKWPDVSLFDNEDNDEFDDELDRDLENTDGNI